MRWKSRREYAVTQSGLEVLVKGEAWVKFKYGQLTYKQRWLVIQGSREFAAINERDGVKLGIYVTGIAPVHAGANLSVVDDREWLEEGEFSGGTEELLESKKLEVVEGIIGEAMAANAELPDRSSPPHIRLQSLEVKKKIHERIPAEDLQASETQES